MAIPEPGAALIFGAGIALVATRMNRRSLYRTHARTPASADHRPRFGSDRTRSSLFAGGAFSFGLAITVLCVSQVRGNGPVLSFGLAEKFNLFRR